MLPLLFLLPWVLLLLLLVMMLIPICVFVVFLPVQPVLGYDGVSCCRYVALPRPLTGSRLVRRQKARPADLLLQLQHQQQQQLQHQQQQQLQHQLQHQMQQQQQHHHQQQEEDEELQVLGLGPALPTARAAVPCSSSSSSSVRWEEPVDLEALVFGDLLLPPPGAPSLGIHWLAIEGAPPALPQNEPPPWALFATAADAPAAAAAPAAAGAADETGPQAKGGQTDAAAAAAAARGKSPVSAAAATEGRNGFALRLYTKQQQQQQQEEEDEEEGNAELLPVEELLVAPKVSCVLGKVSSSSSSSSSSGSRASGSL